MQQKKKLALSTQIFIALVLAIIAGVAFTGNPGFATGYIKPFGTIFLNLIKWIVCPLVFFSIMAGVVSMRDIKKVGAIGGRTVVYYMCTTAFAVAIGLLFANLFKGIFPVLSTTDLAYEPSATSVNFMDTLVGIFPSNFIKPFVEANMLQVIVASLFIGFALILINDGKDADFAAVNIANDICMKAMEMILKLSPVGVFCLLCPVVAENGPAVLGSLAKVLLVAYLCYVIHAVVVYSASVKVLGHLSPVKFFKGMMPAIMLAFSSASSVGTLPLNMECAQKLGADKEVTSFVLPLGATINMDGTAIYQGVCAFFLVMSCFNRGLSIGEMGMIVLLATLASIGTAGVPGAGAIMLAMVMQGINLPIAEGTVLAGAYAMILGIDAILDMGRTALNVFGDLTCTCCVAKRMNYLQENAAIK